MSPSIPPPPGRPSRSWTPSRTTPPRLISTTIAPVLPSGCSPPHPPKGPASFSGGPTDPHCWPPSGLQSPKRSLACRESIGRRPLRRDEVLAKDRRFVDVHRGGHERGVIAG